jgi:phospho-N-acetylmuramoyl-pentapeptide-transferase
VTNVLGAGVLATFLSVLLGGRFIDFLRGRSLGQNIREEGPAGHKTKQGTPTMGGLLIVTITALAYLLFAPHTAAGLTVLAVTVACAAIGFVDDYAKVARKRSLGLSGRWKLALLVPVTAFLALMADHTGVSTRLYVPLLDVHVDPRWGWYLVVYLVLAGATNAVNLTDGLDGLAAGTTTIAVLAYTTMTVIAWVVSRPSTGVYATFFAHHPDHSRLDLAVFCAAMLGACIGFLWYNSFPADVFMGDTGSLALGGALAALAVFTKTELLLVLIGGVFVIEALSVIVQVIAFRRFGRRVFLMAPIHHHFEMRAWSETKIIVRFWIVAALFAGSGFVLYYLRFNQYV